MHWHTSRAPGRGCCQYGEPLGAEKCCREIPQLYDFGGADGGARRGFGRTHAIGVGGKGVVRGHNTVATTVCAVGSKPADADSNPSGGEGCQRQPVGGSESKGTEAAGNVRVRGLRLAWGQVNT